MEIARGQLNRGMTYRGAIDMGSNCPGGIVLEAISSGVIVRGELSRGECVYLCNMCIMTVYLININVKVFFNLFLFPKSKKYIFK